MEDSKLLDELLRVVRARRRELGEHLLRGDQVLGTRAPVQLVLDRVLDLGANVAALPVFVPFAVRDVADAREGYGLGKLCGERGEARVKPAGERLDLV